MSRTGVGRRGHRVPAATGEGVLEVHGLVKRFGGLAAVQDVSLRVEPATITALIGPNGAGKTTLFNCLSGVLDVTSGRITLDEIDITRLPMHRRAQLGIGRTFQRLEVFTGMTVEDNLLVAAESYHRTRALHRRRAAATASESPRSAVGHVLDLLGLWDARATTAGELSTGTLRLVELGRALCIQPHMLLLDEPGSGLDGAETANLRTILTNVAASGVGVLLVEHDVELVMALSSTIYVIDFGRLVDHGPPEHISSSEAVRKAYLGDDTSAA